MKKSIKINVDKEIEKYVTEFKERIIKVIEETAGKSDLLDYTDIKTFEDACEVLDIDPNSIIFSQDTADEIAFKKLKVIIKAINQDWIPDWNDTNQKKWWPWFKRSSGFGFDGSDCTYACTATVVGSRLCFESKEKSDYTANQFIDLYKEFLTISN